MGISKQLRGHRFARIAQLGVVAGAIGGMILSGGIGNSASAAGTHKTTAKASYPAETLTWADTLASTDPFNVWANQVAAEVSKQTHGAVKINIYPNSELASSSGLIQAVETGSASMGQESENQLGAIVPGYSMSGAPFYVTNNNQAKAFVLSPKIQAVQAKALAPLGLVHLGTCFEGFQTFLTKNSFSTVSQLNGAKLAVNSSTLATPLTELGADPSVVVISEVYEGLQLGTITGEVAAESNFWTDQWYRVAPNVELLPLGMAVVDLDMNAAAFARLSTAEQKVLKSVVQSTQWTDCGAGYIKANLRYNQEMAASGATIHKFTQTQLKPFIAATAAARATDASVSPLAQEFQKLMKPILKDNK